jgi:hypothetical protein
MSNKSIPQFEGEPLFTESKFAQLKYAGFGEEVVRRVNEQYKGTSAEILVPEKNAPITDSNTFKLFAIDSVARGLDARVMLPEESALLLAAKRLPEQGNVYYDLGVCLDFSGHNHDLAVSLYEQILQKSLDLVPAVVLGLEPKISDKISYGLEFFYGANSQIRHSPILANPTGNFDINDIGLLETGLPSKLGTGNRRFYPAKQKVSSIDNLGLSGFFLGWSLGLVSGYVRLAGSSSGGRVVLVTSEAGSQNFLNEHLAKLQQERERQNAAIQERYSKAEAILRGQ